jgi:hypothetical protein
MFSHLRKGYETTRRLNMGVASVPNIRLFATIELFDSSRSILSCARGDQVICGTSADWRDHRSAEEVQWLEGDGMWW